MKRLVTLTLGLLLACLALPRAHAQQETPAMLYRCAGSELWWQVTAQHTITLAPKTQSPEQFLTIEMSPTRESRVMNIFGTAPDGTKLLFGVSAATGALYATTDLSLATSPEYQFMTDYYLYTGEQPDRLGFSLRWRHKPDMWVQHSGTAGSVLRIGSSPEGNYQAQNTFFWYEADPVAIPTPQSAGYTMRSASALVYLRTANDNYIYTTAKGTSDPYIIHFEPLEDKPGVVSITSRMPNGKYIIWSINPEKGTIAGSTDYNMRHRSNFQWLLVPRKMPGSNAETVQLQWMANATQYLHLPTTNAGAKIEISSADPTNDPTFFWILNEVKAAQPGAASPATTPAPASPAGSQLQAAGTQLYVHIQDPASGLLFLGDAPQGEAYNVQLKQVGTTPNYVNILLTAPDGKTYAWGQRTTNGHLELSAEPADRTERGFCFLLQEDTVPGTDQQGITLQWALVPTMSVRTTTARAGAPLRLGNRATDGYDEKAYFWLKKD